MFTLCVDYISESGGADDGYSLRQVGRCGQKRRKSHLGAIALSECDFYYYVRIIKATHEILSLRPVALTSLEKVKLSTWFLNQFLVFKKRMLLLGELGFLYPMFLIPGIIL